MLEHHAAGLEICSGAVIHYVLYGEIGNTAASQCTPYRRLTLPDQQQLKTNNFIFKSFIKKLSDSASKYSSIVKLLLRSSRWLDVESRWQKYYIIAPVLIYVPPGSNPLHWACHIVTFTVHCIPRITLQQRAKQHQTQKPGDDKKIQKILQLHMCTATMLLCTY